MIIDKFKRYLEREFRAIKPTEAAMEYREDVLTQLLEKAQELKIKGMTDEELVYEMSIDSLGDFRQTLLDFEKRQIAVKNAGRKFSLTAIIAVGSALLLAGVYLVTSFATGAWALTWLIMVGGVFAGIIGGAIFGAVKLYSKKKFLLFRALIDLCAILSCVFVFLVLLMLTNLPDVWLIFLVMVPLVLGLDSVLGDLTKFKFKYIEYGIFVEVLCVMLYVVLGIMGVAPWHPTWLLCLAGVVIDVAALATWLGLRNKKKDGEEKKKIVKHDFEEKEEYYTEWKDRK